MFPFPHPVLTEPQAQAFERLALLQGAPQLPLGETPGGRHIVVPLPKVRNLAIYGQPCSGKTVSMLAIVYLLARQCRDALWLFADGGRNCEWAAANTALSLYPCARLDDHPSPLVEFESLLHRALTEVEVRQAIGDMLHPPAFFVVDELGAFLRHADESTLVLLERLFREGPRMGVHTLATLERANADELPARLAKRINCRVIHCCRGHDASLLSAPEAVFLLPGDAVVRVDDEKDARAHLPRLEGESDVVFGRAFGVKD